MSSAEPVDLHCQVSYLDESIEGRVSDGRGRSMPFRGWIEFAAALTSLAEDARREESKPPEKEHP